MPSASAMIIFNLSSYNPGPFILVGIPGLEQFHVCIGIPFCIIYIVAVVGNCIFFYLIVVEHSLHEPMFFFLSLLPWLTSPCSPLVCLKHSVSLAGGLQNHIPRMPYTNVLPSLQLCPGFSHSDGHGIWSLCSYLFSLGIYHHLDSQDHHQDCYGHLLSKVLNHPTRRILADVPAFLQDTYHTPHILWAYRRCPTRLC